MSISVRIEVVQVITSYGSSNPNSYPVELVELQGYQGSLYAVAVSGKIAGEVHSSLSTAFNAYLDATKIEAAKKFIL